MKVYILSGQSNMVGIGQVDGVRDVIEIKGSAVIVCVSERRNFENERRVGGQVAREFAEFHEQPTGVTLLGGPGGVTPGISLSTTDSQSRRMR